MKYTEDHEWLNLDGDIVTVGITDHAQEQLGDIVFIELPEVGTQVSKDDEVVVIESVKAASDIAAPVEGEIVEIMGVIALFGYLNRWNDSMGTVMESGAIESGEQWLAGSDWEVGKHQ